MPPPTDPSPQQRRRTAWRVGTPVALLVAGGLFVVSAGSSDGTDLRPGRYTSLTSLVRSESQRTAGLQQRVADLSADVDELTRSVNDERVSGLRREINDLDADAQVTPQRGPGVVVTLSDAPEELLATSTLDRNLLVVHQQDIQAVVNAMWEGGARAITVAGQRIVTTTGIKCVGSNVQLGGRFFPPPYEIVAVGDQDELLDALAADPAVTDYRAFADSPDVQVGWDVELDDDLRAPAYDGLLDLEHARPLQAG